MKLEVFVMACALAGAVQASENRPWLIVNEDNDHYFKIPSAFMTEKALCDY